MVFWGDSSLIVDANYTESVNICVAMQESPVPGQRDRTLKERDKDVDKSKKLPALKIPSSRMIGKNAKRTVKGAYSGTILVPIFICYTDGQDPGFGR